MKKLVKILGVLFACLVLMTSFFYIPNNTSFLLYASASDIDNISFDNTYDYNADIVDGYYSGMGGLGISSFESINFNTYFLYHFRVDVSKLSSDTRFMCLSRDSGSSNNYTYFNYFCINQVTGNNGVQNVNFNILIKAPDYNSCYYHNGRINGYVEFYFDSSGSYVDIYLSQANFIVDSNGNFTLSSVPINNYLSYSGLGSSVSSGVEDLIDFDSDTNFELEFSYDSLTQNIYGSSYQLIKWTYLYWNFHNTTSGDYIVSLSKFTSNQTLYYLNNTIGLAGSSDSFSGNIYGINFLDFSFIDSSWVLINDLSYYTESIDFTINRPSYRVNNTLCIYNFDYVSLLDNVTTTTYSLSRDNDLYVVTYNGVLPNEKYINVGNTDINNILFDTYIDLSFDYSKVPFKVSSSGLISYKFGFDFNFVYYTQPLVTNNDTYNYTFEKPGYKDGSIEFSIVPPKLNIPFTAWVYNAFVFLMFYCPIVSDFINLLHFDIFISALLQIVDLYISSAIGDFVIGCISFVLFYGIIKSLLPSVFVSAQSVYEDSQFSFNTKARKEEKQKAKYNSKQLKYKFKQIDKEYKNKEKRKKKGLPD